MPIKVYYLDDEPDICDVFKENFSSSDVIITTFADPKTALEMIHKSPPDVIFLDYRLPNTNGDLVAQQIKVQAPLILLSGDLNIQTKTNFDKVYSKQPFPWDDIESYFQLLIREKKEAI